MPAIVRGQPTKGLGSSKGGKARPADATGKGRPAAVTGKGPRRGVPIYGGRGAFAGLSPQVAGMAAVGVVAVASLALLLTGGRGEAMGSAISHGVDNGFGALGFAVHTVRLQGASPLSEADIRRAVGVSNGQPILGLDLNEIHRRVERVGWVKSARIIRMMPDTLMVVVTERPRLAVWQNHGTLSLVDNEGRVIPEADASRFNDLPLVVGIGANTAAAAVLPLILSRPKLAGQVWALVRVDNRRWDILLKDNSLIQLPAEGEDAAMMRLDKMDRESQVLTVGFSRLDLKTPDVHIRPRESGQQALAAAFAG